MTTRPLADRFWEKVDKNGSVHPVLGTRCWMWTASLGTAGYGQIGVGGRGVPPGASHRVSWELHFGPIPDGLNVLHKCDVKPCVNPAHFFLGTLLDNNADMKAKGRYIGARSRWTHCKRGHPFDGVWGNGERYCSICHRAKTRAWNIRSRQRDIEAFRAKNRAWYAKRQERRHQALPITV